MDKTLLQNLQSLIRKALCQANMNLKQQVIEAARQHLRATEKESFLAFYASISEVLRLEIQEQIVNLTYAELKTRLPGLQKRIRVLKTTDRTAMSSLLQAQVKCLRRHHQLGLKVSERETYCIH